MTITAIHRKGNDPCGRVAFFYDEDGAPQNMIEAGRVTLPNGSKPAEGDSMTCGSCGALLGVEALDLIPGEWNVRVAK